MKTLVSPSTLNSVIVDMVLSCLQGSSLDQSGLSIKSDYHYLLSQVVRQYQVLPENWHISEAAENLWSSMTSANITNFCYKEPFVTDRLSESKTIRTFMGAARRVSTDLQLTPGGVYVFNQLLIVEHITPVSDVISALRIVYDEYKNKPQLKDKITEIMDKIHLARLLRTEDRSIPRCSHRIEASDLVSKSSDECYRQIVARYYTPVKIKL